jgi:hypothetical protein
MNAKAYSGKAIRWLRATFWRLRDSFHLGTINSY